MRRNALFFCLATLLAIHGQTQTYVAFIYQSPPIPAASAGNDFATTCGILFTLQGSVTGGTSPYQLSWEPSAYLNDPTALNPEGVITTPVTFILTVTDANGCVSEDSVYVTCQPDGLNENPWENTSIHPNPSGGQFRISGIPYDESELTVSCHSIHGIKVFQKNCDQQNSVLDLDLGILSPGIYTLSLEGKNSRMLHKIVIF